MKEKEKSIGQLLAEKRWANRTKHEKNEHMAKMRAAKQSKRLAEAKEQPVDDEEEEKGV